jgi:bifunctional enzyme CysN/CysC
VSERDLIEKDVRAFLARHEKKELLRFLTCGSVDDGKSTLIGRMLYDADLVADDQVEALRRDSAKKAVDPGEIDYSLLVDGLLSEREQGITIDVAYRYFATPRRKFIIADCPGHEQYTRNMATGASTADLAIVLVDARKGILPQTKRHSTIASLLGIRHVVVAVNKMDLVGWDEAVFDRIKSEYLGFAARLGIPDLTFIPLSAKLGDNVVHRSERTPYYGGPTLLAALESAHVASGKNLADLRFPVQLVVRPNLDFRGFAGTIEGGILRRGDEVRALPSGRTSRVRSIVTFDGELEEAFAPMAVTVTLEDEIDLSRGDMLVRPGSEPFVTRSLEATLVWMAEAPMTPGKSYLIQQTTQRTPCEVTAIAHELDIHTLDERPAPAALAMNQIARVSITAARPLMFDAYGTSRATGSFILVDRMTNGTVGAGMIVGRGGAESRVGAPGDGGDDVPAGAGPRPTRSLVGVEERARRLGQKGATVWLTGLPRSGKSAIAYALERRLFDEGVTAHVIDGEVLRAGLSRDLRWSRDDRAENARRAAELARLANDLGLVTIAGLESPSASARAAARAIIGDDRFLEVHVAASAAACEARDPELWARARRGELEHFSGVSAPYEPPASPALVLPTDAIPVAAAVERLVALLRARGVVR